VINMRERILGIFPRSKSFRNALVGYAFLLPNIVGFLAFTFLPIFASLILSFTSWDLISAPQWIGLNNFIQMLGFRSGSGGAGWIANDPKFWKYLWNTVYLMAGIPLGMAGSLLLALALNRKIRGISFLRTVYFLPTMCVPVAVYVLWRWAYHPEFGLINWALSLIGIQGPRWLMDPAWAKPALILTGLWAGVGGYNMILYLAALQNIPRTYYEAAEIDGAGSWNRFKHITWPLLTPTTFFIFITSIIGGFQGGFEAAFMMTQGGPAGSTTSIAYYIYLNAFTWFKMGYAASISWILFLLVFVVTIVSWRYGGRRVHYY